jgi:hypothetical protein
MPAPSENNAIAGSRIPIHEHWWYIDHRSGRAIMADCDWDPEAKVAREVKKPKGAPEPVSFRDIEAIFALARKTDLSIVEAYIEFVGEENIPASWKDKARAGRLCHATNAQAAPPKRARKVKVTVPAQLETGTEDLDLE